MSAELWNAPHVIKLREELAEAARILVAEGILTINYGHISARIPGTDLVCMVGHLHGLGRLLEEATPDDMCMMHMADASYVAGVEMPSERFIHTEIYKARPDVGAVIHGHPYWSSVFGVAGVPVRPVYLLATMFAPEVPMLDYSALIHCEAEGRMVAEALGENYAVLLRGHGNAVAGANIRAACIHAFALERNAQMQYHAQLLTAAPRVIPAEQTTGGGRLVKGFESVEEQYGPEWTYWSAHDPRRRGNGSPTLRHGW